MNHEQEKDKGLEEVVQDVTLMDDLSNLTQEERWEYYKKVCEVYGLDAATRPFSFIRFDDSGKLRLYALRSATDQLRKIHKISVTIVRQENLNGLVYMMTARAKDENGRIDEAIGSVPLCDDYGNTLSPRQLSNAIMTCQTKAIRRATLSICGVSMLDETEILDIPNTTTKSAEQLVDNPLPTSDLPSNLPSEHSTEFISSENNISSNINEHNWISGVGLIVGIQKLEGDNKKVPYHILRIQQVSEDGQNSTQFEAYAVNQLSQMIDNNQFFEYAEVEFKAKNTNKGVLLHSLLLVNQPQMNF